MSFGMEHSTLNPTIVVKNTVRPKQQLYKMAQTSLAFKITNDVIQRSKNIRISNADASKSVYEALYEHEGLKEAGVRDWPDEFQTEVNEGLRENQFVFMDQKDEQALKVLSQEDMKVTSVKQLLESLAIPEEAKGDRISVVLRCKKVTSAPKVVASAPAAAAPTAAAAKTITPTESRSGVRVRIINALTTRSKYVRISSEGLDESIWKFVYENPAVIDANISSWPNDVQTELNDNLREIQCVLGDNVFSSQDMKTTTIKKLLEYQSSKDELIKLELKCERIKIAATTTSDKEEVNHEAEEIQNEAAGDNLETANREAEETAGVIVVEDELAKVEAEKVTDDNKVVKDEVTNDTEESPKEAIIETEVVDKEDEEMLQAKTEAELAAAEKHLADLVTLDEELQERVEDDQRLKREAELTRIIETKEIAKEKERLQALEDEKAKQLQELEEALAKEEEASKPDLPPKDAAVVISEPRVKRDGVEGRLQKVEREYIHDGKKRSPDVPVLSGEFVKFRKHLFAILSLTKEYQKSRLEMDALRRQMYDDLSLLSLDTPIEDHVAKKLEPELLDSTTPEQAIDLADVTNTKSLASVSQIALLYEKAGEEQYEKDILDYAKEWEKVAVTKVDAALKLYRRLEQDASHYEKKVATLRNKVDQMESKGKAVTKKQAAKLARNEEKLKDAWNIFEQESGAACNLIEEIIENAWRDVVPLVENTMKWEIDNLERNKATYAALYPSILKSINSTVESYLEESKKKSIRLVLKSEKDEHRALNITMNQLHTTLHGHWQTKSELQANIGDIKI